jgi:Fe-S cluster assembly scaffold protein SufB
MSRGLTYNDALRIICKSLINPILREINDDEFLNATKPILDKTIGE